MATVVIILCIIIVFLIIKNNNLSSENQSIKSKDKKLSGEFITTDKLGFITKDNYLNGKKNGHSITYYPNGEKY